MKQPASYVVLARKYRPQIFDEVLGQPAVSVTLKNAIAAKRLAHAYLFTGPRGVGKTTMARLLAKALNCAKGPTPEPCLECEACREIAASSSLDVLEMDAASHTGVDNIREVIIETVALAPNRDRTKVFIIDEAHMLSSSAFNALLKTLEEPPPHVVFILATTESAKIPPTIASRCQRFRFRPVPIELLTPHLRELADKEKIDITPEALELLAQGAEGSLRDAVGLLDQCRSFTDGRITEELIREMFGMVAQELLRGTARALFGRDAKALGGWLVKIYEEGVEPAQLLRDLRAALEAAYLGKLGLGAPGQASVLGDAAESASADAIAFLLRRVNATYEELRYADSPRLTLELGLFGCLEAAPDLREWVERLEALERRLAAGGVQAGLPAPRVPAAAAHRLAQPAMKEAASSQSPAPEVGALAALVAALGREKAALAASLAQARLLPSPAGPWKLVLGRKFDLEQAKRSLPLIEAKLATIAGRKVSLSIELGEADPGAPDEAEAAADAWKDAAGPGDSPGVASPLDKAAQILGGKVKIVKKAP